MSVYREAALPASTHAIPADSAWPARRSDTLWDRIRWGSPTLFTSCVRKGPFGTIAIRGYIRVKCRLTGELRTLLGSKNLELRASQYIPHLVWVECARTGRWFTLPHFIAKAVDTSRLEFHCDSAPDDCRHVDARKRVERRERVTLRELRRAAEESESCTTP